jgi:hypothetical protein
MSENQKKEVNKNFEKINCDDENYYSNDCNKFLLKKEIAERDILEKQEDNTDYLYPNINDKEFNIKIATKKEFYDTKYDGTIENSTAKFKERADALANADFELEPQQAFVKNFMSYQTPYNSLLLFHGLGSGKTCSAIGVCEEMRDYMKQNGITKRIIIVASENVQENFKLQMFDERKLKETDGIWNIKNCVGNKLLKEINPTNMRGVSKEKVVSQIKNLISAHYIFLGYVQFANYIIKTINYDEEAAKQNYVKNTNKPKVGEKNKIQMLKEIKIKLNSGIMKKLQKEFDNRLIVIDEFHNIRKSDDNENKKVAINLEFLIKSAQNMRLLFLSATPMYNSYKEIVWLLNLMNINDRRSKIDIKDIFDKNGNFKKKGKNKESGEDVLIRKATGYVSFVRGENPYIFPYRVYPNIFAEKDTFPAVNYPEAQMNLQRINHEDKNRILSLYLNKINICDTCGKCQYCAYRYIIYNLRNKQFAITTKTGDRREMPSFENMESFGYTLLQTPLESLIISYPIEGLKNELDNIKDEKISEKFARRFAEISNTEEKTVNEKEGLTVVEETSEQDDESNNNKGVSFVPNESDDESDNDESDNEDIYEQEQDINDELKGGNKNNDIDSDSDNDNKSRRNYRFVDPQQLTGKKGLERMMEYVGKEQNEKEKGYFEYKKNTLEKYGRIFSRDKIGDYSIKIKSILEKIYDNEKVSEGIILIYSQYIDSGLIPMALALEEMGFTRYGQPGTKPLFKNKPTDLVDVRTMKPPENKTSFMPARYAMITGDTRLSPNNNYEVKGLTNDDNKNGHKIKVILISKAGSEGIDFKFIRQVHILEPWYNMNRIEQIIGRAVRSFSHKLLDFEKRNVQIFMHGTIFTKDSKDSNDSNDSKDSKDSKDSNDSKYIYTKIEAADLYVYRIAEYKAIQIGKITRVLKETAVDCIIHHGQTNFTQDKLFPEDESLKKLKEPITQIFSTGIVDNAFKIGDAPFSPNCDYMAKCNYDCKPNKDIDEDNLNEDTYNEYFINVNSEKIVQRIRMLMKESFFYKKNVLIDSIRVSKNYPYIQIYSALTHLIEDENEIITDKYGRNGRLINIGEYYLFQPLELRDKNASIFDRTVPIDYKHNMINFKINKNLVNYVADKRNIEELKDNKEYNEMSESKLLKEMKANYELSQNFKEEKLVPRGDDNWYKYCGIVIQKMTNEYPESVNYLNTFLVEHILEVLLYEEKLETMNYLYSLKNIKKDTFEWLAKEYFDKNSIASKYGTFFIMYNTQSSNLNKSTNTNNITLMKLNENNIWEKAQSEDEREFFEYLNLIVNKKKIKTDSDEYQKAYDILNFNAKEYNDIIGFIGYEKNNKYLVFKTKNMSSKKDTGARCDEATKNKNLKKINDILGEEKYTKENTKMEKGPNKKTVKEAVGNVELCVFEEFILRYFNEINKDGKKWFLTPELAIKHSIYKFFN